jgi:hypothetical protein
MHVGKHRSLALCVAIAALGSGMAWTAAANARMLRYRGHRIAVPAGWPIRPVGSRVCVRLDRSAVYVGTPGAQQRCPAHAAGRSRAIVIELRAGRVEVLRGAAAAAPARGAAHISAAVQPASVGLPASPGEVFSGLGFDACAAPSISRMSAWAVSPYRAIGVYIGGSNMACTQPNLTPQWVALESAAGWHLIPTYVGLQAPVNSCGCAAIDPGAASAEGAAAATDAISNASELGIGAGNPIYADIEFYPRTQTNSATVLAYLSAWTTELHAHGYLSGVYGSSDSVVPDLVAERGTGYPEPDDIWFAQWNGEHTLGSAYIPATAWTGERLHQYSGGHRASYRGVAMRIDSDAVDGATAASTAAVPSPSSSIPDGTFVEVEGTSEVYRVAGGAPLFVSDWSAFGGPQPATVITQQQFDALNPVPLGGTLLDTSSGSVYRVAGGAALPVDDIYALGGVPPAVTVDEWDTSNAGNPLAHLVPAPADGTAVEGMPSGSYWLFEAGRRRETAPTPIAVRVNDQALSAFPAIPCVVPRLRHMSITAVKLALRVGDCSLGRVRRVRRRRRLPVARVLRQWPVARSRLAALTPVSVTLG